MRAFAWHANTRGHHDLWDFPAIDDDIVRIEKFVGIAIGRRAGHSARPHESAGSNNVFD
jgi:hypothetical protein